MALAVGIHALTLDYEFEDRDLTIHPVAVETDRGVILLDTGLPGSVEKVADELDAAGLALDDVTKVLITHHDGDHAGGLRELVDETGAEVLAHREEAPYVDGRGAPIKGDPDDRYPPVAVDVELVGGIRFRTTAGPMQVVDTPGHAPGHVSPFFPHSGLLIAADALVSEGGELSGPKPEFTPEMDRAMESVGALTHLDVERTHCYHGGTVEAGSSRIETIYENER